MWQNKQIVMKMTITAVSQYHITSNSQLTLERIEYTVWTNMDRGKSKVNVLDLEISCMSFVNIV